jgi:hypothetical protein
VRRNERVSAVIRGAIDASKREHPSPRRHPADVTADRLVDRSIEWDKFDGSERDAIGQVIHALREIAEGER